MIRPVYIYGSPILRKVATDITPDYPELAKVIDDMHETMEHSDGIGLAAPQIGLSIRLFVVNGSPLEEDDPALKDFKKVFINAKIVEREDQIRIQYVDENFQPHDEVYSGTASRIIQHEYDHLDGIMFPDRLSPLRRKLLAGKLLSISKGKFEIDYKYKLPK